MKKSKLIIGIILLVIGIISFVFVPGGFLKTTYQDRAMQTEKNVEYVFETQPIPLMTEKSYSEEVPEYMQLQPERTSSVYNSGKTIFYEIYGIAKDLLSLIATIYGIMIAKKTLLEKKKT